MANIIISSNNMKCTDFLIYDIICDKLPLNVMNFVPKLLNRIENYIKIK